MVTLKISPHNLQQVKQARKLKGWAIDDFRWLEVASNLLNVSWERQGYLASGISEGTWKRFLSGKYGINVNAFKAYCQVLGLEWEKIIDRNNFQDWGKSSEISQFFGRKEELNEIVEWILQDCCRLVTISGIGGIGKTSLALKSAKSLENEFEFVVWRSLEDAPTISQLLTDLMRFFSQQSDRTLPKSLDAQISLLVKYLRKARCLLILDRVESVVENCKYNYNLSRVSPRNPLANNYSQLFKAIAEIEHQSSVILTSRTPISVLTPLEGQKSAVKYLQLQGLPQNAAKKILQCRESIFGSDLDLQTLADSYQGHPWAIDRLAVKIEQNFKGSVGKYLAVCQQDMLDYEELNALLEQQFACLTRLEQQIMYWLAIRRNAVFLRDLQQDTTFKVSFPTLLSALASLKKYCLIEKNGEFVRQPAIISEYVNGKLRQQIAAKIKPQTIYSRSISA